MKGNLQSYGLIVLTAALTAFSNLALRRELGKTGFEFSARFLPQALQLSQRPFFIAGICFYALAALLWFRALTLVEVSVGYPILVSCTFLLVTTGSVLAFGESISFWKLFGLALILGGIQIVARS